MRTCDDHRLKGWFFFPGVPDHRIPGILTWTQVHGAVLELIGGLSPEPDGDRVGEPTWPTKQIIGEVSANTIYGESDSGKRISLWGAERGNYIAGGNGRLREEFWHASWVCVGAHLTSGAVPAFHGIKIALDDLYYLTADGRFCAPQWAQIEGVEHPSDKRESGTYLLPYILPVVGGYRAGCASGSIVNTSYNVDTTATRPWVSPATEADPALKLEFMINRRRRGPSIELSVSAHARVALVDGSADSAEGLLHRTKPLFDLMSLATFDNPGVEWMKALPKDGGEEAFLLCRTGHPSEPDERTDTAGVVFTLDDVSLDEFLETWQRLTSGEQAQYAWNVVVGLIGHSPLMVEEHVSQVLAAAEGFHTWCLAGGAKPELKSRLIALHDKLPADVKTRLQLDVDRWADWAVWARNHVAHGGTKKHRDVGDFYQFKIIADSVRLVTYLAALKEFRVPDEKLTEALITHPQLRVLAGRCAEIDGLPDPSPGDR